MRDQAANRFERQTGSTWRPRSGSIANARITPSEKSNEKAPDFRIFAGKVHAIEVLLGAAMLHLPTLPSFSMTCTLLTPPPTIQPVCASTKCGFRFMPATYSEMKPATIPI